VFENRVLRRIFVPKREKLREWRKIQAEELHKLFSSLGYGIEVAEMCGACRTHGWGRVRGVWR